MDSSSASNVSSAKKEWSEDLTIHLESGMQQVLARIEEQTMLLEGDDAGVMSTRSLMTLWQSLAALLAWPLQFEEGKQHISAIARKKNAQKVLDKFNKALKDYCAEYQLPEIYGLTIDENLENIDNLKYQVAYISLICWLWVGIKQLESSSLYDASMFDLCKIYGTVLYYLEGVDKIPKKFCSSDSLFEINEMISTFETKLKEGLTQTVIVELPEELKEIDIPLLEVDHPEELKSIDSKELHKPIRMLRITGGGAGSVIRVGNKMIEAAVGLNAAHKAGLKHIGNTQNQVQCLKDMQKFWKDKAVDRMLLQGLLNSCYFKLREGLEAVWNSSFSESLANELKDIREKMIEDTKEVSIFNGFDNFYYLKFLLENLHYNGHAAEKWSDNEAFHFKNGMQQVLSKIKEVTKLLEEKNESVLTGQLLIIIWKVFYCFVWWALRHQGSRQPMAAIMQTIDSQRILGEFNVALKGYCQYYEFPQFNDLSVEKVVAEDLLFSSESLLPYSQNYMSLICALWLGTRRLAQLGESLKDPSFHEGKARLENPDSKGHYILREVFETISQTYGDVLYYFSPLKESGIENLSDDGALRANAMIQKFEIALKIIFKAVDQEALPVELKDWEHITFPKLQEKWVETGKRRKIFCAPKKYWEGYYCKINEQQISELADIRNQVQLLRAWSDFWRNDAINPVLLQKVCGLIYFDIESDLKSLWDGFPSDLFRQEFKAYHPKIVQEIKELKASPIFSDVVGNAECNDLLRLLDQYPDDALDSSSEASFSLKP